MAKKYLDDIGLTSLVTLIKNEDSTVLSEAESYTDTEIANLINGAPTTLDTLAEIATAIEENADVVAALDSAIGTKANASDLSSHVSDTSNPHNVTLTQLGVTATASELNVLDGITATTTELNYTDGVTSNIQTQLNAKADSSHTHSSYANQNAFSNVLVGSTTIAADTTTDTLTITAGDNVTITPDATNDALTISSTDTIYTHPTYTAKTSGLYKVTVDSTGHVSATTAVTKSDITGLGIPSEDTDTHYVSSNVVGATTAISDTTTALTNGNVYLNSVENGEVTSSHKISGSGATTVTTDASGNIIITSTDTDVNTDINVTNTLATTTKAYVTGTTSSTTNTGTQVFDTGVYLGATAGSLYATTFYGALSGNATTATALATSRTIQTNLASATATSFDGTSNITIGVTGILPIANGGTGTTTGHIAISTSTDTTSTSTATAGGTFTVVDSITRDSYGHVTKVNTKTVTLPDSSAETVRVTATNPSTVTTYYGTFVTETGTTSLLGNNGFQYLSLEGTTSALGYGILKLGNSTASGTAANKYGAVRIYGTSSYYWDISGNKTSTSNKTFYLPNATTGTSLVAVANNTAIGSSTLPVYVNSSGEVTACGTSLAVSITGNAATATSATSATTADTATLADTVKATAATTTKAYVLGVTATGTTPLYDTGVYLNTTAGSLVATTFTGSLSGNATTATTLATARTIQTNLSSTASATFNGSANVTPGVTGTLAITNGGTGATTAAGALVNLGITATAAELNTLDGITATVTELNYCGGVTSSIQTQIDSLTTSVSELEGEFEAISDAYITSLFA